MNDAWQELKQQRLVLGCVICAAVVVLCIVAGVIVLSVEAASPAAAAEQFNATTEAFVAHVRQALNTSLVGLEIVSSLLTSVSAVDDRTFTSFIGNLRDLVTTNESFELTWAEVVPKADIAAAEARIRAEGFSFTIHTNPGAFNNGSYALPITVSNYFYPNIGNSTFRGFDLLSDPTRTSYIMRATMTHSAVGTPFIASLNANSTDPIFNVYCPVYNTTTTNNNNNNNSTTTTTLLGVLYQTFQRSLFVSTAFNGLATSDVQFTWSDASPDASMPIIYQLNTDQQPASSTPLTYSTTIEFAQRDWVFAFTNLSTSSSGVVEAAILISVLLLCAFVIVLSTVLFVKNRIQIKAQLRSTQLLSMVVPDHVSRELVPHVRVEANGHIVLEGNSLIAERYRRVILCFIDICNFTPISACLSPDGLVRFLDELFTLIDTEADKYDGEIVKIKTIGDSYFAVAGLTQQRDQARQQQRTRTRIGSGDSGRQWGKNGFAKNELEVDSIITTTTTETPSRRRQSDLDATSSLRAMLAFSLRVQLLLAQRRFDVERETVLNTHVDSNVQSVIDRAFDADGRLRISVRIGVHCGDVVAGVVGKKQPQYDVWGTACNMASRVESSAVNGSIQISQAVYDALINFGMADEYVLRRRKVTLKGVGRVAVYTLTQRTGEQTARDDVDVEMSDVLE